MQDELRPRNHRGGAVRSGPRQSGSGFRLYGARVCFYQTMFRVDHKLS
jgi:hypothetical protein